MPIPANVSAVAPVSAVSRLSGASASASAAQSPAPAASAAAAAPPPLPAGREQIGLVIETVFNAQAGAATQAAMRDETPQSGVRNLVSDGMEMKENSAAKALEKADASEKTQETGAATAAEAQAAESVAAIQTPKETLVETLIKQASGGDPGATVKELSSMIEAGSPLREKTDLAESRIDAPANSERLARKSEDAIAEGKAERSEASKIVDEQALTEKISQTNAQQGAYSTLSLASVSSQSQRGRAVRLSM